MTCWQCFGIGMLVLAVGWVALMVWSDCWATGSTTALRRAENYELDMRLADKAKAKRQTAQLKSKEASIQRKAERKSFRDRMRAVHGKKTGRGERS